MQECTSSQWCAFNSLWALKLLCFYSFPYFPLQNFEAAVETYICIQLVLHSKVHLDPLSLCTAPPTSSGICLTEQIGPVVLTKRHQILELWGLKL